VSSVNIAKEVSKLLELFYALLATIVVSLLSLIGVFALSLSEHALDGFLFVLLSFSAGSILGAAYFDLLPEAVETSGDTSSVVLCITAGFLVFFFLERFIYWYHGHIHGHEAPSEVDKRVTVKRFVYLNMLGDGIHNFIDGMVIAASFFLAPTIGLVATTAVVFHELPQEIGDFGVLVYGGLAKKRALFFNFLSALTAVAGALLSNFFAVNIENFVSSLVAFAAGGFIYLAASELIPEMQREKDSRKSAIQFVLFIFGLFLIWSLGRIFPA